MTQQRRRRLLTDDLLIGASLVTFFIMLGILLTLVMVEPTGGQRVPSLILGTALGFSMLFGALKVAHFRAEAAEQVVRRTVVEASGRTTVEAGRDV